MVMWTSAAIVIIALSCRYQSPNFTVVLLPDTQYYTEEVDSPSNPYYHQAQWIVDHGDEYNIKFVIHLGDITQDNDPVEWNIADSAHAILDGAGIPYSMVPGNHDYPRSGGFKRDTSNYNDHFGPQRFEGEAWYGGHFGDANDNNYTFFEAAGMEFMVVGLEYAPTKDALCWANEVIRAHSDRRVIVVTHCYQTHGGGHLNDCADRYDTAGSGGETVWRELVSRHSNIFAVVSGHITDSEHEVRTGNSGNDVHEILTDYQSEEPCCFESPYGGKCGGADKMGNGWLRTLEFRPGENRVVVSSHSAEEENFDFFIDGIPWFFCGYYNDDPSHEDHLFDFYYDMTSVPDPYAYDDAGGQVFHDRTVNTEGSGQQERPDTAMDSSGFFVVSWQDDRDDNGVFQIYARGFGPGGCESFADIVVNSVSTGQQEKPAIAMDSDGNFVVAWEDDLEKDGKYEIFARGFYADGTEQFSDITVNSTTSGQQIKPAVAVDSGGAFVVTWQDDKDDNGYYQIYARGFHANGTERFPDMTVNSESAGQQKDPAIAMHPGGQFVVAWEDDQDKDGKYEIFARGFYADGTERFHDITVNSDTSGQQINPAVDMDAGSNFVVVWQDDKNDNGYYQIYARGFHSGGTELLPDMTVNSESAGQQERPDIAMDAGGNFVVTWQDDQDDNGYYQIYARGFDGLGDERFHDITVNTNSSGQQTWPTLAMDSNDNFVVTWEDDMDGNDYYQILARGLDCHGGDGGHEICDDWIDNDCDGLVDSEDPDCIVEFTLELEAVYVAGELSLSFSLGTPEPATWANYLILTYPAVQIIPLWSVPLPVIDPPIEIPVAFPLPSIGWVGIYTSLFTAAGPEAVDLAWVDTGFPRQ